MSNETGERRRHRPSLLSTSSSAQERKERKNGASVAASAIESTDAPTSNLQPTDARSLHSAQLHSHYSVSAKRAREACRPPTQNLLRRPSRTSNRKRKSTRTLSTTEAPKRTDMQSTRATRAPSELTLSTRAFQSHACHLNHALRHTLFSFFFFFFSLGFKAERPSYVEMVSLARSLYHEPVIHLLDLARCLVKPQPVGGLKSDVSPNFLNQRCLGRGQLKGGRIRTAGKE